VEGLLLVDFTLDQYWLESGPPQPLTAIYHSCGDELRLAVTDRHITVDDSLPPGEQYRSWVASHRLLSVDPGAPLRLQAETIAKPWGCEIWFTGVERRAVCHFAGDGARVPIPWLQAALPAEAAGAPGEPVLLLKILDPAPQPVLGDLYFELHETKREVYVVTRVDRQAWPDGTGYIRYGFDPRQIARYPDHHRFRMAYLAAVTEYEAQRRVIDTLLEQGGTADAGAVQRERQLRQRMDRFTALRPLKEGDVVQVPLLLPHALQHGVRVVEVQSATYERKILSFAQKVLTQEHWDTREAVSLMRLLPPDDVPCRPRDGAADVEVEQIADYPDFEVQRITMQPERDWQPPACSTYRILTVLSGSLDVAGVPCEPEQAVLLPRFWCGLIVAPGGTQSPVFLLARPRC
jgi:hypothetical protein